VDKCRNEKLARKLLAYELGILSEDDSDAVETHLLECPECNQRMREMCEASQLLRNDADFPQLVAKLDTRESSTGARNPVTPAIRIPFIRTQKFRLSLAVAAAAVLILLFKPWNVRIESDYIAVARENRVLVMPFNLLAADHDSLRRADIITNLLITDLSESKYLQVSSGQYVKDVEEFYSRIDTVREPTRIPEEIVANADIKWIISGKIVQLDPILTLTVQLVDAGSGSIHASHRVDKGDDETIFSLVDRTTSKLRDDMLTPLGKRHEFDPSVADVTTHSAEAYRWYLEGVELYGNHHFREAEECYHKAVNYDSTFAMGHYCLVFHGVQGALEKAVKYAANATQKEQLYIFSLEASRAGDEERSFDLLEQLVARYPDEKIAWMELAFKARQKAQYDEAIHYLRRSLDADPMYGDALNLMAYIYSDMGDLENALTTIDRYVEIVPDEPNPYDSRGEILAIHGRPDEAILSYERAVELKPDFIGFDVYMKMGRLFTHVGRYDDARACLRKVIADADAAKRSDARAHLPLVSLYEGKLDRGLVELLDAIGADRLEQGTVITPAQTAFKYFVQSCVFVRLQDFEGAIESIETALRIMNDYAPMLTENYHVYHAYMLALAGQTDRAQETLDLLRNFHGTENLEPVSFWKALGFVSYAAGDPQGTIKQLENIPDNTRLGFDTRFMRGKAYLDAKEYQMAMTELEGVLQDFADPKRFTYAIWAVEGYYYLALAEEYTGRTAAAISHYEKFVDIWSNADPGFPELEDAKHRLSELRGMVP